MTATVAPVESPTISEHTTIDTPWVVVVWDDPVNLMDYVTFVFQELFRLDKEKATTLMLQVHNEGRAAVFRGMREQAELHTQRLHGFGLWATMEK